MVVLVGGTEDGVLGCGRTKEQKHTLHTNQKAPLDCWLAGHEGDGRN